ncbi:MAG: MT-A70 family methyltransferase [Paracoccaceae bacterium]
MNGMVLKSWGGLIAFKYRVIYVDPPWKFETYSGNGGNRAVPYPTMTLDGIKALRPADLAHEDCLLAMWVTDPFLAHAMDVLWDWGFDYKTVGFTWVKPAKRLADTISSGDMAAHFPIGMGHYTRANPEMCLFATRGSPKILDHAVRQLIVAPKREHSRKPDRVRDDLMRLCRGPYVELFARQRTAGWDAWGNEADRFGGGDE